MKMLAFAFYFLFLPLFSLSAQHSLHLGAGMAGLYKDAGSAGAAVQIGYDYNYALSKHWLLTVGAGIKQMEYRRERETFIPGRVISAPPVPWRQVSTQLIRPTSVQMRLAVERRFGPVKIGGGVLSSYRLHSEMGYDFTSYSRGGEPTGEFELVPIQYFGGRPENPIGRYHQYESRLFFEGSLTASLDVSKRFHLGMEYQRILTRQPLIYSNESDCIGPNPCSYIGTFRREIDAIVGMVLLRMGYYL